jgi:uncharacterized protein YkwD
MRFSKALIVLTAIAFTACAAKPPPPTVVGQTAPPAAENPNNQGPQLSSEEIAQQLLNAVNQQRAKNGLRPLELSPELAASAQEHSAKMSSGTFLNTRGTDEPSVVTRISSHGVKTLKLGENVGRIKIRSDRVADDTVSLWMGAAADRQNILSPIFTKTGIGVARAADGDYYLTEDFAQ